MAVLLINRNICA